MKDKATRKARLYRKELGLPMKHKGQDKHNRKRKGKNLSPEQIEAKREELEAIQRVKDILKKPEGK